MNTHTLTVPRLRVHDGHTIQLARWYVSPHQSVFRGTLLAELEDDALTYALVAPADGIVDALHVESGAHVHTGDTLLTLVEGQSARAAGEEPTTETERIPGPLSWRTLPKLISGTLSHLEPVVVPFLSESMTIAEIAQWEVEEGQRVEVGQALVELDTDKVTVTLPSEFEGIFHTSMPHSEEGQALEPGAIIGYIEIEHPSEGVDLPPLDSITSALPALERVRNATTDNEAVAAFSRALKRAGDPRADWFLRWALGGDTEALLKHTPVWWRLLGDLGAQVHICSGFITGLRLPVDDLFDHLDAIQDLAPLLHTLDIEGTLEQEQAESLSRVTTLLSRLRRLDLRGDVSNDFVEHLTHIPSLTPVVLGFHDAPRLRTESVAQLAHHAQARKLVLSGVPQLKTLQNIALEPLEYLSLRSSALDDDTFDAWRTRLPTTLVGLSIADNPDITDTTAERLATQHLPKLTQLDVRKTHITTLGTERLQGAKPSLRIFSRGLSYTYP